MTYKEYIETTYKKSIASKLIKNIKMLRRDAKGMLACEFDNQFSNNVGWCFTWDDSPEGHEYWANINKNIEKYYKKPRTHKKVKNLKKFKDVKNVK